MHFRTVSEPPLIEIVQTGERRGGLRWTPERVVQVRALAGFVVLCSWARHLTLTVPLSTQEYKWVPATPVMD